jgi:hypothetical protein
MYIKLLDVHVTNPFRIFMLMDGQELSLYCLKKCNTRKDLHGILIEKTVTHNAELGEPYARMIRR